MKGRGTHHFIDGQQDQLQVVQHRPLVHLEEKEGGQNTVNTCRKNQQNKIFKVTMMAGKEAHLALEESRNRVKNAVQHAHQHQLVLQLSVKVTTMCEKQAMDETANTGTCEMARTSSTGPEI